MGIQSTKEAVEAHASRDEISSQIKAAQAELDGMGAEDIAEELQNALNELTAANASVERLTAVASDVSAPEDKANAKSSAKALEKKLSENEEQETESKTIYECAGKTLGSAEKSLTEKRLETEQQRDKLTGLNAQLELLLKTHGEDAVRSQALLMSITRSISSSIASSNGFGMAVPALFTRISSRPKVAKVFSTAALTASASAASA